MQTIIDHIKPAKDEKSVSYYLDKLCAKTDNIDDVTGVDDLIRSIDDHVEQSGPKEAAEHLRYKIKNGKTPEKLRAVTILDILVENAHANVRNAFNVDTRLLEQLKATATDEKEDPEVKKRLLMYFDAWEELYSKYESLQNLAGLHKQVGST